MSRSTDHCIATCRSSAKHLPSELTDAHPDIAWPQIRGFRNILVHQYFGVDLATVRDVVETHLPPLAAALRGTISNQDWSSPPSCRVRTPPRRAGALHLRLTLQPHLVAPHA